MELPSPEVYQEQRRQLQESGHFQEGKRLLKETRDAICH
jgi:hypothetical protein